MSNRKFLLYAFICSYVLFSVIPSSAAMNVEIPIVVRAFLDNPIRAEQTYMGKEVQTEGEVTDIKRGDNGKFVVVLKEIGKWDNYYFNCELSSSSLGRASNLSNGSKIEIRGTIYQFHQVEQGIFVAGNIVTLSDSVITRVITQSEMDFRKELGNAQRGDRNAQYSVGWRYERGDGVARNYDEAIRWYREAIAKGHVSAMERLALMYRDGRGVEKNPEEAITLFRQAAERVNTEAMVYIGEMYENGNGVDKNIAEALSWYNAGAIYNEFALDKLNAYANEGNPDAIRYLADIYYYGRGRKPNYSEALKLYGRISGQDESGYVEYMLAQIYEKGQGTERNIDEAVRLYQSSAEHGYADSAYRLYEIYRSRGTQKDLLPSIRYLKRVMNLGHEKAKSAYERERRDFAKMPDQLEEYVRTPEGKKRFKAELPQFIQVLDKSIGKDNFIALIAEFELNYDFVKYLESVSSGSSSSSGQYVIRGEKVNVRAKPNTRAKVVLQLNTGEPVTVLETSGRGDGIWYKIKTSGGKTGWVFGKFIQQN